MIETTAPWSGKVRLVNVTFARVRSRSVRAMNTPRRSPLSSLSSALARKEEGGRQRSAEVVRGGGRKAVELGQMLLARQHQFGGGERVGKLARFFGDLERIETGDADREQDRKPDAVQIDLRQYQRI